VRQGDLKIARSSEPNARRTEMTEVVGYCVKCKEKRPIKDAKAVTMANGRPAMKGTCPTCGTGMFKILSPVKQ
jgi:hypothetical protein